MISRNTLFMLGIIIGMLINQVIVFYVIKGRFKRFRELLRKELSKYYD